MIEEGFLDHWTVVAGEHPDDALYAFAWRVVEIEKVVASSKLTDAAWPRTRIVRGPLAGAVAALKAEPGDDIICFGAVRFATALLAQSLLDEPVSSTARAVAHAVATAPPLLNTASSPVGSRSIISSGISR